MKQQLIYVSAALMLLQFAFSYTSSGDPRPVVTVAGSSCMGRMLNALADAYEPARVDIQLGGSEQGLYALRLGVCDIASCSRELTESESDIDYKVVAIDAIAVIVHPENPVASLSSEDIADIYSGKSDNWSCFNSTAAPIVVVGREAGSGTRSAFLAAIGLETPPVHGQELCETGMVRTMVAQTPGAIGYISREYVDDTVRCVPVDGIYATQDDISDYAITRPLLLCVKDPSPEAAAFLEFAVGERGQEIIRSLGIAAAADMGVAG